MCIYCWRSAYLPLFGDVLIRQSLPTSACSKARAGSTDLHKQSIRHSRLSSGDCVTLTFLVTRRLALHAPSNLFRIQVNVWQMLVWIHISDGSSNCFVVDYSIVSDIHLIAGLYTITQGRLYVGGKGQLPPKPRPYPLSVTRNRPPAAEFSRPAEYL